MANLAHYDFSGWATKNNLLCKDGRIIKRDAFKIQDGQRVPIVWNHQHNSVDSVLGHGILENRPEGVYMYGKFNNTKKGQEAKECVQHGDVTHLSIWANDLKQNGNEVEHGIIREVSLVLAGANPGAFIESVVSHGEPMEDYDSEGIFYTDDEVYLNHAIEVKKSEEDVEDANVKEKEKEEPPMAKERTVQDVIDSMNEEQKKVMYALIGDALENGNPDDDDDDMEDDKDMKHNLFSDGDHIGQEILSHSDMMEIIGDAKRNGSLRDAFHARFDDDTVITHAIPTTGMVTPSGSSPAYGIHGMDFLFPEFRNVTNMPTFIQRDMDWVNKVMSGVHKTPFSRIKSVFANITEDEARAKGYIKGKQKKDEVFTLLKRTTDPQTVFKKQRLDRDDIIDITDFDVVSFIKVEMRLMLNEEIARAILIGDGRLNSSDDKIQENHIRPIIKDVDLFNITAIVEVESTATPNEIYLKVMDDIVRARKDYKGSGNPTFWTTESVLTEMLLLKDTTNQKLYKSESEVATALRVKEIVTVEPMEGVTIEKESKQLPVLGVIVNLQDYNVGADKGGAVNLFDDFDIDFNQQKYLIETRCSGALVRPFSAITVLLKVKD